MNSLDITDEVSKHCHYNYARDAKKIACFDKVFGMQNKCVNSVITASKYKADMGLVLQYQRYADKDSVHAIKEHIC